MLIFNWFHVILIDLIYSARLNETQETYYGYEAKTLEKQRLIDTEGIMFELLNQFWK